MSLSSDSNDDDDVPTRFCAENATEERTGQKRSYRDLSNGPAPDHRSLLGLFPGCAVRKINEKLCEQRRNENSVNTFWSKDLGSYLAPRERQAERSGLGRRTG